MIDQREKPSDFMIRRAIRNVNGVFLVFLMVLYCICGTPCPTPSAKH